MGLSYCSLMGAALGQAKPSSNLIESNADEPGLFGLTGTNKHSQDNYKC